jgi:hypothetical protein
MMILMVVVVVVVVVEIRNASAYQSLATEL